MADTFNGELIAVAESAEANAQEAISVVSSASTSATNAANSAAAAASSASAAASSANAAAASAGGQLWVSGTTYGVGALVFSSVTGRNYRRLIAGAGTTDPSSDSTNWMATLLDANTGMPTIRPALLLDFANSRIVDPRITFTRASTATRINERGLLETVAAGVPRIDFDPVTLACRGWLIEESRTNLLLNSTIDGANLATQTVTVTAVAYTLSFYGTGTVTLSGAHAASAVGVGAYPSCTTLTFTPTAGSLTLTVTGTVQFAQLETGAFPTSYIPTTSAAATCAADVASITGANFSSWYRQDEGTFVVGSLVAEATGAPRALFAANDGTNDNTIQVFQSGGLVQFQVNSGASQQALLTKTNGIEVRCAVAYKSNNFAASFSGAGVTEDTSGSVPVANRLILGAIASGTVAKLNGHIRRITYYPKRLSNAELQALTTP